MDMVVEADDDDDGEDVILGFMGDANAIKR